MSLVGDKTTNRNRVVITGIGVIAANGIGKEAFWRALVSGTTGVRRIQRFDPARFPTQVAGEVLDFDPLNYMDRKKMKRLDRFVQMIIGAARMAIDDSQLSFEGVAAGQIGVLTGTSVGGQGWALEQLAVFNGDGYRRMNPFTTAATFPNASSAQISIEFGLSGPSDTISSGCASSSTAIGVGLELIRAGKTNVMVVGGSECLLYPPIFGAYCAARIMSKRNGIPITTPRPFDASRDGTVLGEGAAILILEELHHAVKRGAYIYGELAGWGSSCAPNGIMDPGSGSRGLVSAIHQALTDAGLSSSDISYIKAHGSGQINVDSMETKAIKEVFHDYAYGIPISSVKSMIGHTIGASGAIELAASLLALQHNLVPPTLHLENHDPQCNLNFVPNVPYPKEIKAVLSNTIGFGGKNVAIVVKRYPYATASLA
jgi:3-oxoacyl-[acyl-carrier-protein] synthase II